jgi:hypothetical protein
MNKNAITTFINDNNKIVIRISTYSDNVMDIIISNDTAKSISQLLDVINRREMYK